MLKKIFFALFVKPLVFLIMGINLKGAQNIPSQRPYVLVANHNSHLDTLILMSLFPLSMLKYIHPVAAADYFFKNRYLGWFALNIIGIIPVTRESKLSKTNPLKGAVDALNDNEILIIFPEGSRGEAEQMSHFKTGVAHLAKMFPTVPIVPISIYGAGKSLPRGGALFVPFVADIEIGKPLYYDDSTVPQFTHELEMTISSMHQH